MAARPVSHSLAAFTLAFGLAAGATPALAQNYIGSGNIQVNLQALDQLGSPVMSGGAAAAQKPLLGATGKAPKAKAAPVAIQSTGPQPLLGETKSSVAKPRAARAATATKKAVATAPKSVEPAKEASAPPAAAATSTAVPAPAAAAPAPAAVAQAPAASAPATAAAPAPVVAPKPGAPMPVVPAQPAA
ncbi:MAG: hypothetical protein VW600_07365, partial [Ferrovibrio sp.]